MSCCPPAPLAAHPELDRLVLRPGEARVAVKEEPRPGVRLERDRGRSGVDDGRLREVVRSPRPVDEAVLEGVGVDGELGGRDRGHEGTREDRKGEDAGRPLAIERADRRGKGDASVRHGPKEP